MTQQQWGRPNQPGTPPPGGNGRSGGFGQQSFGQQGFGQGGFGQAGLRQGGGFGQQPGNGWGQVYGQPQHRMPGRPAPAGQPWAPGAPPPRGSNPLRRVLAVVIALAVVALLGLIVVNIVNQPDEVAYQNDDYTVPPPDSNPPPLPYPETAEQAKQWIDQNKIYDQNMPIPVRCELKPITSDSTDQELETHLNNLMACLVRAWEPPTAAAGFTIVRPSVTIYGDEIQTKCGKAGGGNAFYCPADQQVYYSRTLPDVIADLEGSPWGPDVVLAHEFGHAMQARTGILLSANGLGQQAGQETEEGLELSRRVEVQADCFSGMFLRSTSRSLGIQQSDVQNLEVIFVAIGDDTLSGRPDVVGNHGRSSSRLYWGREGIGTSQIGTCNTFTAPADQVR